MRMAAELSLYPLAGEVDANVLAFIDDIAREASVSMVTNAMSTQIYGDAESVFNVVQRALEQSYARSGRQVLVAKFIPGLSLEIGPEIGPED